MLSKFRKDASDGLARAALEQAIDAVVIIDTKNRVTFYNAAAEALWGYPADEVLGRNVNMLVPPAHRAGHDALVERHRTSQVDRIVGRSRDVTVVRRDGCAAAGSSSSRQPSLTRVSGIDSVSPWIIKTSPGAIAV